MSEKSHQNDVYFKDFIKFQISRQITKLFKSLLVILEDFSKIEDNSIDFDAARKKVLDSGNDAIREIDALLDKVEIRLKKDD